MVHLAAGPNHNIQVKSPTISRTIALERWALDATPACLPP
jgi:hypothetical protein